MPKSIPDKMLSRIAASGPGAVFTPKDFLDLANHETVRQALARMVTAGTLRRLRRGVYDYPAFSTLLNAPASPDPDAMARAIAREHGWTIAPAGAAALNLLGLSTQVPAQWEYHSDGPPRTYVWTGGTLRFKHRTNKETSGLSPRTALLVQGLKALTQAAVEDTVVAKLRTSFDAAERKRAAREARYVTAWVYEVIKRLAAETEADHARNGAEK